MHSVEHKSKEFLWILLPVATELASNSTYLTFEIWWCDCTTFVFARLVQQFAVACWKAAIANGTFLSKSIFRHKVLRQGCSRENTLNYWIHKASITDVSQTDWCVTVATTGSDYRHTCYFHFHCIFITIWLIFFFESVASWPVWIAFFSYNLWTFDFFCGAESIWFGSSHLASFF